MSKKIILLGSKGMLGQMVQSFFNKKGYDVIIYNKRFDQNSIHNYFDEINSFEGSIVINCIGRIKQKSDNAYELLLSNSIFPLELSRSLKSDHLLIHPSTDCVFDGFSQNYYLVNDKHTATDLYGISKSLGEKALSSRPNTLILRVSIIGPDYYSNKGLLSWFLNNPCRAHLNGFTNHFWNGITTLEWCKKLQEIINSENLSTYLNLKDVIQLGSEKSYSKYDLLCRFQDVFKTDFEITPFYAKDKINRCLKPMIVCSPIEVQLGELSLYMKEDEI